MWHDLSMWWDYVIIITVAFLIVAFPFLAFIVGLGLFSRWRS